MGAILYLGWVKGHAGRLWGSMNADKIGVPTHFRLRCVVLVVEACFDWYSGSVSGEWCKGNIRDSGSRDSGFESRLSDDADIFRPVPLLGVGRFGHQKHL